MKLTQFYLHACNLKKIPTEKKQNSKSVKKLYLESIKLKLVQNSFIWLSKSTIYHSNHINKYMTLIIIGKLGESIHNNTFYIKKEQIQIHGSLNHFQQIWFVIPYMTYINIFLKSHKEAITRMLKKNQYNEIL